METSTNGHLLQLALLVQQPTKEWCMQYNIRLRGNYYIHHLDAVGALVKYKCLSA